MSQINRDDYGRRRSPVTVDEQLNIINEYPERYSDLVGYFSLPLTNVEFKNDNSKIYWRVVGSSQWKVMFDFDNVVSKGMRFKGEVTKFKDIKQLIDEDIYRPQQGDVWRIEKNNNVIVYYQAHWVTLVQGGNSGEIKIPEHTHNADDIKGLDEKIGQMKIELEVKVREEVQAKIEEEFQTPDSSIKVGVKEEVKTQMAEELSKVYDEIGKVTLKTKVVEQPTSSDTWSVSHNLGRYPIVTVVDSSGNVIMGDVVYTSENDLQVRFTNQFSGKVYLT